jgi:uncharacterized damage-inducible protein DinB
MERFRDMLSRTETIAPSLLGDAFAHHVWATERLIDECESLAHEQLDTVVGGTYGSILETLHHLVESDRWYLGFYSTGEQLDRIEEKPVLGLDQLRSEMQRNAAAWTAVLTQQTDAEADVPEHGDGWEFHAPASFRLAQVIHHGTDHRSQVCTALTSLGLTPPEIDLWAYGEATGRTRALKIPAGSQ